MKKPRNSFLIALLGLAILCYFGYNGTNVASEVVELCAIYILGRAGLKGVGIFSASKDPDCDTMKAIEVLKD